jgi:L-aspartate oxidase
VLNEESGRPETLLARQTILATGGVGQIYLHSTNAPGAVGSGVSMASRAGLALYNLEFVQFHPTALYHRQATRSPLITEALRGEGARLLDGDGRPFMLRYDKRGDLAPRDVVAKAMLEEMLRTGQPCLYLDAGCVEHDLQQRFPTVFQSCAEIGVDMGREPIPVVPAAHYSCGGILSDLHGRTTLEGLYAVGECACTGVHGANRLASASLLEGLLWGLCAGKDAARRIQSRQSLSKRLMQSIPDWEPAGGEQNDDPALIAQDWAGIRHTMWNYVGISRTSSRLRRAFEELRDLSRHIHDFYKRTPVSKRLVDLFHGCQAAYVITQSAMRNKKSLGCHNRVD